MAVIVFEDFSQTALPSAPVVFTQSVASASWVFNHTLNRVPVVSVTDLAGNNLFAEIRATLTSVQVVTSQPITGIVYLS